MSRRGPSLGVDAPVPGRNGADNRKVGHHREQVALVRLPPQARGSPLEGSRTGGRRDSQRGLLLTGE